MIRIDALWLPAELIDMRAGSNRHRQASLPDTLIR
jgi:hypothetical protein